MTGQSVLSVAKMYEAVGRAVGQAQIFEAVVVICAEMVRICKDSLAGNGTDGLVNPNRFKAATRLLLKQLAQSNDIAPDFEARVAALVEKRHILIHRWFVENGWPGEGDSAEIMKLTAFAQEVESESRLITLMLVEYILNSDSEFSDVRPRLADIFQNVKVDGNRSRDDVQASEADRRGTGADEPRR